jgi:phosphoglycolate phosphatase-like HAD superfamily hydrolase
MTAVRVILFDVDGTLLRCGPQVRPIFAEAMVAVYGTTGDLDAYDFSGKTDQQIVLELLAGAGLEHAEAMASLPRMQALYLESLERRLDCAAMEILPGVEDLLGDLSRRRDVALGLLTGNWRRGAEIKLSRFALDRFFRFGAFGDDGIERTELPPVALERAAGVLGRRCEAADALIVGDSTRDVECARAHGVPVLGVATGWTSAERLRAAGADRVVESLAGLAEALATWPAALIGEPSEPASAPPGGGATTSSGWR